MKSILLYGLFFICILATYKAFCGFFPPAGSGFESHLHHPNIKPVPSLPAIPVPQVNNDNSPRYIFINNTEKHENVHNIKSIFINNNKIINNIERFKENSFTYFKYDTNHFNTTNYITKNLYNFEHINNSFLESNIIKYNLIFNDFSNNNNYNFLDRFTYYMIHLENKGYSSLKEDYASGEKKRDKVWEKVEEEKEENTIYIYIFLLFLLCFIVFMASTNK